MYKKLIPKFVKRLYHLAWAMAGILIYGKPSKRLKIIGVTGTDGKTTTTSLIYEILKADQKRVGMINGLRFILPGKDTQEPQIWPNKSDNSTPGKLIIRQFLAEAVKRNCEYVVLEVTSWGIEQFRVLAMDFDVVAITNLTYEHVDLHGSLDKYRYRKGQLFKALSYGARKVNQDKVSIVNLDDESASYFLNFKADKKITYSLINPQATLYVRNIQEKNGLSFEIIHEQKMYPVNLQLWGEFNVANALAATGVALACHISWPVIQAGLSNLALVPGRMEFVKAGQNFHVIVDFAHTPNGFKALFQATRKLIGAQQKIIAVFGATGGRDPGRRPMMGEVAGEMVDFSVLTSEDPRRENPALIAKQIMVGLTKRGKKAGQDFVFIRDRAEAILYACKMAKAGDAVLLCSMGDYDVMYVGDGKIPWSDREVARLALAKL